VSEKFDGVRALWDGQRLRTRRGTLLNAPAWFLARLPAGVALDGELWLGRGRFDEVSALLRRQVTTDEDWRALRYLVFELPGAAGSFEARAAQLQALSAGLAWPQLRAVPQTTVADAGQLQARLEEVLRQGGEGLMLHRADAPWRSGRSDDLYKLKPAQDAEATVIGYTAGRGRHLGRVGALRVRNEAGEEFLIGSGLSDAERSAPPALGSTITYTHRGETSRGLPRFATFLRMREEP
jgi:DNA ligase-1